MAFTLRSLSFSAWFHLNAFAPQCGAGGQEGAVPWHPLELHRLCHRWVRHCSSKADIIDSISRNMIAIPFALGEATNGLVAYILPEWIHFQVAILATHIDHNIN